MSTPSSRFLIPSLSPLTDRKELRATPNVDGIAQSLESDGPFAVSWDRGLHINQSLYDSCRRGNIRPRTPSILTFSSKMTQPARPHTSGGLMRPASLGGPLSPLTSSLTRPATSGGLHSSSLADRSLLRASSQSNSVSKSMSFLNATSLGASIPAANLTALSESGQGRPPARGGTPTAAGILLSMHLPQQQPSASTAEAFAARLDETLGATADKLPRAATVTVMSLENPASQLNPSLRASSTLHDRSSTVKPFVRRFQAHPMANFKPSRAQALIVFNQIDTDKTGKVTMTEMENAIIGLGFPISKAHEIFRKLDRGGKGYLSSLDWGDLGSYRMVELLCHLYMKQFMGLPSVSSPYEKVKSYFRTQELKTVRTLGAAINLIRVSAVMYGAQSATACGDVMYDAFRFIDTDNSGTMSKEELVDGFAALGMNLSEGVTGQVMQVFDKDGNGRVEYHEFVKTLFPKRIY